MPYGDYMQIPVTVSNNVVHMVMQEDFNNHTTNDVETICGMHIYSYDVWELKEKKVWEHLRRSEENTLCESCAHESITKY